MKGKKWIALLLALGMCFAVAACDNTETSSDTGTNSESGVSSNTGTNSADTGTDGTDSSDTEPDTVTTVTASEWADALAWKGQTNWKVTTVATQGETSMTQVRACDGTTVHVKMTSGAYSQEQYYTKEGEKYYCISNDTKKEIAKERYEEQLTAALESTFVYSDFTYVEEDKAYTVAEVKQGDTIIAKDVVLKFEDRILVSVSMLREGDREGVFDMSYAMTWEYGTVETIKLPTLGE